MKANKTDLLNFAKGQPIGEPKFIGSISRNGEQIIFNLQLTRNVSEDLIIKVCNTREDSEFYKSIDLKKLIDNEKKRLILCEKVGGYVAPEDVGL